MPNIKSAIKRVDVTKKNTEINKGIRTKISTYTKKFKTAIANKDIENAEKHYKEVVSVLDNATRENVIHQNNASRKSAHFAKMLDDAKKAN